MLTGATNNGATAVAASDAKGKLFHGRKDDDAFGIIEKVGRKIVRDIENLFENVATSLETFDFFLAVRRVCGKAEQADHAERLDHVFYSHSTSRTVARIDE